MKKFFKLPLSILLTVFIFLAFHATTSAQYYYSCNWDSLHNDCGIVVSENCTANGCTIPGPACGGMDINACIQQQACDCGEGNYRCEKPVAFPLCSLVNNCSSGCYEPPGACTAGCTSDSPWTTCVCGAGFECEHSSIPGRCVPDSSICSPSWWIQSDCIPEEKCVRESANCVQPSSTPTPTPDIKDCQDLCTDLAYPLGQCLDTQGINPPNCVNPPSNNNYDCAANDLDCLCCSKPTPRPTLGILCSEGSIDTAIGCIPVSDQNEFMAFILRWALGIAGGVSFLLIIYSGFTIMTAGGDPRKLQSGRELMTAAISGLILIIFSVFILDLIGIRILRIPGL